jgi:hypothetical protein
MLFDDPLQSFYARVEVYLVHSRSHERKPATAVYQPRLPNVHKLDLEAV